MIPEMIVFAGALIGIGLVVFAWGRKMSSADAARIIGEIRALRERHENRIP